METLTIILLGISFLFSLLLIFKQILGSVNSQLKEKFCVLCAAVVLAWLTLLILSYLQFFSDKIILAILMGESSLAVFYLLEKKESLKLFRLPLLLTLIVSVYFLIQASFILESLLFILFLWAIFSLIYLLKTSPKLEKIAQKIIACCRED